MLGSESSLMWRNDLLNGELGLETFENCHFNNLGHRAEKADRTIILLELQIFPQLRDSNNICTFSVQRKVTLPRHGITNVGEGYDGNLWKVFEGDIWNGIWNRGVLLLGGLD